MYKCIIIIHRRKLMIRDQVFIGPLDQVSTTEGLSAKISNKSIKPYQSYLCFDGRNWQLSSLAFVFILLQSKIQVKYVMKSSTRTKNMSVFFSFTLQIPGWCERFGGYDTEHNLICLRYCDHGRGRS